jgi:hypothetical protein
MSANQGTLVYWVVAQVVGKNKSFQLPSVVWDGEEAISGLIGQLEEIIKE